jgi:opacity protein-like surface antigen
VVKVQTLRKVRTVRVLTVLMALLPAIAAAQDGPRGYIVGSVGVASAVENDSAYAGLGAWRINPRVHIFGEVGRLRNAIGEDLSDQAALVEDEIVANNQQTFNSEFPVVFEARVPTWYGLGGVRIAGPSGNRFSTYFEGGAGTGRLDPRVHLTINGENLDSEAEAITGLGRGTQELAFLTGLGAGVGVDLWKRIRIEGGYRYMRFFGDAKVDINRVHVGAGWTF